MTETAPAPRPAPAPADIELMHRGATTGNLHYGLRADCTLTGCTPR